MLDLYEPDIHWLPKLSDVINFDIPAEVAEGIPLLFTGVTVPTGIDTTSFWRYLQNQYGEHRLLWEYTLQDQSPSSAHGLPVRYLPRIPRITNALISIFDANNPKYIRLLNSLNKTYDPLEPYNVFSEDSSGAEHAKLSTTYGQHTDTNKETSMDSTTQQPSSETTVGSHTDDVVGEHNMSVTFEAETLGSTFDDISHAKGRRKGNLGNMSYADLIDKEVKLSVNNLYDIISRDITDMICYKIFASC